MTKRTRGKEVKGKKQKEKPHCKIYIFTEGETEKIYLQHYESKKYNVEVIPVDSNHTDAVGIVRFAKEYIENEQLDLELGDKGYCVFDSDPVSNPNINEAFNLLRGTKSKGLDCIFSNPSFELWFVMHFCDAPYGLTATKMKRKIKSLVKDKCTNYCETTDIYEHIKGKQEEALKRAISLHNAQKDVHRTVFSHECNPYTNIFEFVRHMEKVKKENEQNN